jgi:hypothetical protein
MAREILVDDSDPREIIAKMLRSAPRSSRDELQQEWNGPGDENASEYLRERGYVLAKDYWIAPVNPAFKDIRAIAYLHLQWDYPKVVVPLPEIVPPRHRQH